MTDKTEAGAGKAIGMRVRMREFSRSVPMALLRTRESVMRHFRPSLRHFDLTEQQWRVLRALASIGEIEVTQLAHATCLLAPSLSRILKDLDERHFIVRRADENDMRTAIVSLSAEGNAFIEAIDVYSETIYSEITQRLGAERIAALMKLLAETDQILSEGEPIGTAVLEDIKADITMPVHFVRQARARRGRPKKDAME